MINPEDYERTAEAHGARVLTAVAMIEGLHAGDRAACQALMPDDTPAETQALILAMAAIAGTLVRIAAPGRETQTYTMLRAVGIQSADTIAHLDGKTDNPDGKDQP